MARDPRKHSAFDSGMRGREKPKVADAHGKNANPEGAKGGEEVQSAHKTIGDPEGIDQTDSAYSSGMRGTEKAKQKPASGAANDQPKGPIAAGNNAKPHSTVGDPAGHDDARSGVLSGVPDSKIRPTGHDAYALGNEGANNTEIDAGGEEPKGEGILGEEDDTHINIRIPKASLKKKTPGLSGS